MRTSVLKCLFLLAGAGAGWSALAEVPAGFYDSLDGKSGSALLEAVAALAKGHKEITYGAKTWAAFESTDVIEIEGEKVWRDLYSNNLVYLPDHASMNIEHSVANSWWGGDKNSAYKDLFHLNPSDQMANNKKSSWPPGIVADATVLDNGILKIGTPAAGYGGESKNVFEPADHFKGDFARAYFYLFASYPDIAWQTSDLWSISDKRMTLKPWASKMLLEWNEADPVDSEEMARNEAIYALQNNRNPFIDYPGLAEACFGNGGVFSLSGGEAAVADRPVTPRFPGNWLRGRDTYASRWWKGVTIPVDAPEGNLFISVNGAPYEQYGDAVEIDSASKSSEVITLRAYSEAATRGVSTPLRSPVATLTLTALNPDETDYSQARWEHVASNSDLADNQYGIILSGNTLHVMSTEGGRVNNEFMESGGFVRFGGGYVTELPTDAALVSLVPSGGKRTLAIHDIKGKLLGYWLQKSGNKNRIDPSQGTPCEASVDAEGHFIAEFSGGYSLQFNATQPRFTNYSTSQTPVYLYRFLDFPVETGVGAMEDEAPVAVYGGDIIAPEGMAVFDLNGRRVKGLGLRPGVYIVAGKGRAVKVMVE